MRGLDLGWRELSHIHMARVAAAGLRGEVGCYIRSTHGRRWTIRGRDRDGHCDRCNSPNDVQFLGGHQYARRGGKLKLKYFRWLMEFRVFVLRRTAGMSAMLPGPAG